MAKQYSPVVVTNPSSTEHVVSIHPGQQISLHLDPKIYKNIRVVPSCDRVVVTVEPPLSDGTLVYSLASSASVDEWPKYSSSFLADVWIDYQDSSARLVVMLACSNPAKSRFVTIVNPDCNDIRIQSGTVIEVVLFHPRFTNRSEWTWEYSPDQAVKVDIEEIGKDTLTTGAWSGEQVKYDDPDEPYARFPRSSDYAQQKWPLIQTHFWFRLEIQQFSITWRKHLVSLGKLKFFGWADGVVSKINRKHEIERHLTLRSDLSKLDLVEYIQAQDLTAKHQKPQSLSSAMVKTAVVNCLNECRVKRAYMGPFDVILSAVDFKEIHDECRTLAIVPSPPVASGPMANSLRDLSRRNMDPDLYNFGHFYGPFGLDMFCDMVRDEEVE